MNYLDRIIEFKRKEVEKRKKRKLKKRKFPVLDFKKALIRKDRVNLIAEIKKKSPSKGVISRNFDPVKIAFAYKEGGAVAISVLTDKKFFSGSLEYIGKIKKRINIPILAKDFFIDEYQILEAYSYGADAVLIIVSILSDNEIHNFLKLARKLKIDAVVEVHTGDDIRRALIANADIIGINNRDLKTFKVDITTTTGLIKFIPGNRIVISESGIKNSSQVRYLADNNVDAVLIGETLIKSNNISEKISELLYG